MELVTERWSIGALNPALTAVANDIRVGEHSADRLRDRFGTPDPPVQSASDFVPRTGRLPGLSARSAGNVEVDHGNDPEGSQQCN